ncbi:hypothetical protein [Glycomyces sp. NPDC048151]|uniref:hypothetical protein n=1 Tax=Glycomyces sp. NPDC048151 TaxID=3364002 RepID=UPI00371E8D21
MIPIELRDETANSPDWTKLGEFYIGIGRGDRVRFTVFRSRTDPALHRLTADEMTTAGPRLIAILTEPPSPDAEEWHPAWQKDPMRETVETRSRAISRRN